MISKKRMEEKNEKNYTKTSQRNLTSQNDIPVFLNAL